MKVLRSRRPSPAFVLAAIALFVALGGVSVAAVNLAPRSVKASHIATDAIGARQIADNAVAKGAIRRGAISGREIRNGSLSRADFAQGALAGGAITGLVDAAGTSSGNAAVTVTHLDTGKYQLSFPAGTGAVAVSVTPFGIDGAIVAPVIAGESTPPNGATTVQVWLSSTVPGFTGKDNGFMFTATPR